MKKERSIDGQVDDETPKDRIVFRDPFAQLAGMRHAPRRVSSDGVERVPPEVVL